MSARRSGIRLLALALAVLPLSTQAQQRGPTSDEEPDPIHASSTYGGLAFRSLGPGLVSGRVSDLAVHPEDHATFYVAVASGGVWKTTNGGTTFTPIFDDQGSYSIGTVTLDPNNPNVVWVGTGENNAQRSVAYGDGVYKSLDGGTSWENVGLKDSGHIGSIVVDPRDSDVVYIAAHGPLWSPGGDRGLYKTTDGGATWERILEISEHTGVNEVHLDPRDPDVLYASAWQRRRHVWTLISGGPESALYKSTDGGETWRTITDGLPTGDVGRIGLCLSPVDPDYVYAIIEAANDDSGTYRSTDRGERWTKQSTYHSSGNYYQELICDPHERDRVYSMNTLAHVTDDGGATWSRLGERSKHVDNHALWVDPGDPTHYLIGTDGGVYESFDRAATWRFFPNLPVTQFYKVAVDEALPFYNIYGGTQDNATLGGPSRTTSQNGITDRDWFITVFGDGFETAVDPTDPNTVYSQAQYGYLVRHDRRTGRNVFIQPQEAAGEPGNRWNWDAPILISPHDPHRLYFGANRVYRSDDRGDDWTAVSPDLTRGLDRNALPVMDRVWSVDAVAKNKSTSIYGNLVALDESPLREGLLYAGTDDGLVHVTADGGGSWRRVDAVRGVPERTYVNQLVASRHQPERVYAAFNNHKTGDFRPYLQRSDDAGETWTSIVGDLPERGSVYTVAEDHVDPDLLFAGTEFGVFFTRDGGERWTQFEAGIPTIAVRDIAIQRREDALVLATFGRGFYVLDDYSPLRHVSEAVLDAPAHLFPVDDALLFEPRYPLGIRDKAFQGEDFFIAENPPVGAVFTYWLKEKPETLKAQRQEIESDLVKAGEPINYPTTDALRAEDEEEAPYLLFEVEDAAGAVVRRLRAEPGEGIQRAVWDFRYPAATPVSLSPPNADPLPWEFPDVGPLVAPGRYAVSLWQVVDGVPERLTEAEPFSVVPLYDQVEEGEAAAIAALQQEANALRRASSAASAHAARLDVRLDYVREAVRQTPAAPRTLLADARALEARLNAVRRQLDGDTSLSQREFETPPSITGRVETVVGNLFAGTDAPTGTQRRQLAIAETEIAQARADLDAIDGAVNALEAALDGYGAPYIPRR